MPRFAKKGTTKQDILDMIVLTLKKANEFDEEDMDETQPETFIEEFFHSCVAYTHNENQIRKDLSKITFDFENVDLLENVYRESINGKENLPDGTAILWCFAGGDWEYPVDFVLYIDDKNKLRGYIPSDGNIYCHKCKTAYGSCECEDQEEENDHILEEQPEPDFDKMYLDICKRIQTK